MSIIISKVAETSFQSEYYPGQEIDQNFEIRVELINDVFLIEEYEISTGFLHYCYHEESVLNTKYTLYLRLLYSIFLMKCTTDHGVEEIFIELYKEWEQFLKYETFPVSFIITLPNLVIDEDIEVIKNRIFFRKSSTVKCISNNNWISSYPTLLFYRRKMSGKLYPSMKERNDNYLEYNERFEEEYKQIKFELQELVVTLYLHDIDFEYFPFFMKLPWWFTFNIEEFEKLERDSFKEKYKLSTSKIKKAFELFPALVKSKYFRDETYVNLYHNYIQLFNRYFFPDTIKDVFILFEFLFMRESSEDIAFQFALNASLFLSMDKEEFIELFSFLKRSYRIRSDLVHGGEWQNEFEKLIQNEPSINNKVELLRKWIGILNKAFRKLIALKSEDKNILNDINQLENDENVLRRINFLLELSDYYNNKNEYSYALKILYDSIELIKKKIQDPILFDQILGRIKQIHENRSNLIVFFKELQKIKSELILIKQLNIEKSEVAKDLIKLINKYCVEKEPIPKKLILKVNGNDIMKVLNIPESPQVGIIKELLIEKVNISGLNNNKEDLIEYLKNNIEELR